MLNFLRDFFKYEGREHMTEYAARMIFMLTISIPLLLLVSVIISFFK